MRSQAEFAVVLVDLPSPAGIVLVKFAQALPADFQEQRFVFREDRGRSWHPSQGRQLTEQAPGRDPFRAVFVEDHRDVGQENPFFGESRTIADLFCRILPNVADLRDSRIAPKLRESLDSGTFKPRSPEISRACLVPLYDLKSYDLYSSDAKLLCEDLPRLEPVLMQSFSNGT